VLGLGACDAVTGAYETMKESIVQAQAVSEDVAKVSGVTPGVSINWKNGELAEVALKFESVPKEARIADLAEAARASIRKRLMKEPKQLSIAFSIPGK
jgi:hypothetical protein